MNEDRQIKFETFRDSIDRGQSHALGQIRVRLGPVASAERLIQLPRDLDAPKPYEWAKDFPKASASEELKKG
jgi:hypothetical protein